MWSRREFLPYASGQVEQMPNQMKPVENQRGIGEIFADRLGIRRPHVATDRVDRAAASGVQPAEKRIECFFLPVFTNPDELMPFQIVDQRQVAVTALPADLIHADDVERLPRTAFQAFGNNALHDLGDRFPVDAKMPCHFQPVQLPGQQGHCHGQRNRHPAPGLCPRNLLDLHPLATDADHTEWPINQFQRTIAHAQIPPSSARRSAMRLWTRPTATATAEPSSANSFHVNDKGAISLLNSTHIVGFHSQLFSDKRFHAHWTLGSFQKVSQPERYSLIWL